MYLHWLAVFDVVFIIINGKWLSESVVMLLEAIDKSYSKVWIITISILVCLSVMSTGLLTYSLIYCIRNW